MVFKSCLPKTANHSSQQNVKKKPTGLARSQEKSGLTGNVPELGDENKERGKDMGIREKQRNCRGWVNRKIN